MDVNSVSEHAMMIIRQAVGRGTAAWKRRCDGGHDYAKGVKSDHGNRTVRAHFGNKPAQHAALTPNSPRSQEAFLQLKTRNEAEQRNELVYTFDAQGDRTGIAALMRQLSELGIDFRDLQT